MLTLPINLRAGQKGSISIPVHIPKSTPAGLYTLTLDWYIGGGENWNQHGAIDRDALTVLDGPACDCRCGIGWKCASNSRSWDWTGGGQGSFGILLVLKSERGL